VIHKQDVVDPTLVQESELVQSVRELFVGVLGRTFEPLHALLRRAGEAEVAVQFGRAEAVHRAGVETDSGFPA
jgi:hypothetical protein